MYKIVRIGYDYTLGQLEEVHITVNNKAIFTTIIINRHFRLKILLAKFSAQHHYTSCSPPRNTT